MPCFNSAACRIGKQSLAVFQSMRISDTIGDYGIATDRTDSEVVRPLVPVTSRRMLTSVVLGV